MILAPMRPQPRQHRPHLNGPLRSMLLWLLNQLPPLLDHMAEYRQEYFLTKRNILEMIPIVIRVWMSLKENIRLLPEGEIKRLLTRKSLSYMKMQPWEKEKYLYVIEKYKLLQHCKWVVFHINEYCYSSFLMNSLHGTPTSIPLLSVCKCP